MGLARGDPLGNVAALPPPTGYCGPNAMARKPEIAELPTRLLMQTLGSERRYKRIVVFGGIGVVILGGVIYGIARTVDARETAAREAAFGALGSCLIGEAPLKDGEAPSARVAEIKL